ncbi:MAG: hypothetical protein H6627_06470 [Calditrichae bacterium]|nr:hypothetical protein [Calditrichota bacterium]MCB9058194.1 hypothetical protein [Calditrichia bacterium]
MKTLKYCIIICVLFLAAELPAKNYIVLLDSGSLVCCQPDRQGKIIGDGNMGEMYLMLGELEDWYMVQLFTNECRYVPKKLADVIPEEQVFVQFKLPESELQRKALFENILKAREKAEVDAQDQENEEQLKNFLEDRYILKIFQENNIHPALFSDLVKEAELKHWN